MPKTPTQIRSLARKHTKSALRTLVGIAGQAKAPAAARVSAAVALLDRGWGKPAQHHDGDDGDNPIVHKVLHVYVRPDGKDTL